MDSHSKPRVLLLGDSICMSPALSWGSGGYAPLVASALAAEGVEVVYLEENGSSTRHLLEMLAGGRVPLDVALIHFNAGLHDVATRDQGCAVPLDEYERNLRQIVAELRARSGAELVFGTTTPVLDDKHRETKGFIRRLVDVVIYNQAAGRVMAELCVPINDLFGLLLRTDLREALGPDGCHMSLLGRELLAGAVADLVRRSLGSG